ncbi:MAG: flagellar basal-body MS-ring/collar protein FliF [Thermodesulfobacteriota bacterium]
MAETPYRNLIDNIRNWPLSRKLALAATVFLCILFFVVIIFQSHQAEYRPLYTELPRQEAASVTSWLKENGVAYQLKNNGRSIYVPAGMVYETRLNLAGAGLPKQGGVGFEIFDKQNFGVTKFTQKINYQRAMQGELARTIAAMDRVKSARIHLVMPEKRLLKEQQKQAKASVVVDLASGRGLDRQHTQGIVHLVSGSIEGLEQDRVNVIDTNGRTLNQSANSESGMAMLPDSLKFKKRLESRLEEKTQSLLDRALGAGNSIVRVSAEMDFTREAITKEEYDPDSLVPRSEQITESQSGRKQTGGVPGVESNLGDEESADSSAIPTSKNSESVNYEINKTVRQINNPVGTVENITAAVLVADKYNPAANNGEGAHEPIPDEKRASIRKMVTTAIGLDTGRGDRIEVESMPFQENMGQVAAQPESGPTVYDYVPYVKYAVLLFCALLVYLALVRPMIKTLRGEAVQYNRTVAELEDELGADDTKALDPPATLRRELADSSVTPTQVIRTWLKEG